MSALMTKQDLRQLIRCLNNEYKREQKPLIINYRANPSLAFPKRQVESYRIKHQQVNIIVNILIAIGAGGVLPLHYTENLLKQLKSHHTAFKDFLDIFHHRIIEYYYTSWQNQQLLVDFEKSILDKHEFSTGIETLSSLLGESYQYRNIKFPHIQYFSSSKRSKEKLIMILNSVINNRIEIDTQKSHWEKIPDSMLFNSTNGNILGETWLLGNEIRMDNSYFTVIVFANSMDDYQQLLDNDVMLNSICYLTREYMGFSYRFAINVTLPVSLRQPMKLYSRTTHAAKLGKTSFI